MLMASSVGFVMGPVLGGFLSNSHWVRWFGPSIPLCFAALVALINAWLMLRFFHETFHRKGSVHLNLHHAFSVFASAFSRRAIRYLSCVMVVMMMGWSSYFSFIGAFMMAHFHFTSFHVSLFLTMLSVGFALGCYAVEPLLKYMPVHYLCALGFLCVGLAAAGVLLSSFLVFVWVCDFTVGFAMTLGYATLITLFSSRVNEDEQGWVMGVTGSIMALCFGLSVFASGLLASLGTAFPLAVCAVCMLVASLALLRLRMPAVG